MEIVKRVKEAAGSRDIKINLRLNLSSTKLESCTIVALITTDINQYKGGNWRLKDERKRLYGKKWSRFGKKHAGTK